MIREGVPDDCPRDADALLSETSVRWRTRHPCADAGAVMLPAKSMFAWPHRAVTAGVLEVTFPSQCAQTGVQEQELDLSARCSID